MKLTYWVEKCKNDVSAYNIRSRTRKECFKSLESLDFDDWRDEFENPVKVEVEYESGFDLMEQCLGEGHSSWEPY